MLCTEAVGQRPAMDGYPVGRTLKHGYHSIGGARNASMTEEKLLDWGVAI